LELERSGRPIGTNPIIQAALIRAIDVAAVDEFPAAYRPLLETTLSGTGVALVPTRWNVES